MKLIFLLLTTITFISNVFGQHQQLPLNVNSFQRNNNVAPTEIYRTTPVYLHKNPVTEFALKLFQGQRNQNSNLVLSPVLLQFLLAIFAQAAAGDTKLQLQQIIGPASVLNLRNHFVANAGNVELSVATGLFIERTKSQNLNDSFVKFVNAVGSRLFLADFLNHMDGAKAEINQWASDATYGQIPNLFGPAYNLRGSELVLATAAYFHNSWKYKFHSIGLLPFYKSSNQIQNAEFMEITQWLICERISFGNFQGTYIELPYEFGNYSMILIIPEQTIDEFVRYIDVNEFVKMIETLNQKRLKLVKLQMPKFKISTKSSLVNNLVKMGLVDLFTSNINLPYLSKSKLIFSDIIQEAALTVNEEGTIAAAAMASLLVPLSVGGSTIIPITINQPFLSIILDKNKNAPLFISKITDIR